MNETTKKGYNGEKKSPNARVLSIKKYMWKKRHWKEIG